MDETFEAVVFGHLSYPLPQDSPDLVKMKKGNAQNLLSRPDKTMILTASRNALHAHVIRYLGIYFGGRGVR